MKTTLCAFALAAVAAAPGIARDRTVHNPKATNDETILHAWSWNFPAIADAMKQIAGAGFTMVQTSPVQHCYSPEGSGKKIFDCNGTKNPLCIQVCKPCIS